RTDRCASPQQWDCQCRAVSALLRARLTFGKFISTLEVIDMNGPSLQDGSAHHCVMRERTAVEGCRNGTPVGPRHELRSIAKDQDCVVRLAQAGGALHHRVQHGLDISRRAANDTQDLTRRCLSIESGCQLTVASLQFLEQAHILNGDDSLVGERLQEFDLVLWERPHHSPGDADHSDAGTVSNHGHEENTAEALFPLPWDEAK